MFQRAKQIKLPAEFVDIRHQATHQDLPTSAALRQIVRDSLAWIWTDFWLDQCSHKQASHGIAESQDMRQHIEHYKEIAVAECKRNAKPMLNDEAMKICRDLVRICKGNEDALNQLAIIMIEWGFMVPDTALNE